MKNIKNFKETFFIFSGIILLFTISPYIRANLNPYLYTILLYTGINIIAAASLNLIMGITGLFSMGHAGFMSIGGYTSAFITTILASDNAFLSSLGPTLFLMSLFSGGLVSALFGIIVGLPSLRLRGDYLAIVTLGFGEIIRVLILNLEIVGGARGLPGIPQWTSFGWVYSTALVCVLFVQRITKSAHGRSFLAIREDEVAAQAAGVHATRYKVLSFSIGAFFAGIAGGLFAHFLTYLNPQTFDFNRSFEFVIMVVLGGIGSTVGSVISAAFLTVLREALRPLQEITKLDFRMLLYSFFLIAIMLVRSRKKKL